MPEAVIPERITASSFLATQICSTEARNEVLGLESDQGGRSDVVAMEEIARRRESGGVDGRITGRRADERADPDHRAGNSGAAGRVAGAGPERRGYGAGQPDAGDTAVRRILGAGAEDHVVRERASASGWQRYGREREPRRRRFSRRSKSALRPGPVFVGRVEIFCVRRLPHKRSWEQCTGASGGWKRRRQMAYHFRAALRATTRAKLRCRTFDWRNSASRHSSKGRRWFAARAWASGSSRIS